MPRSCLVQPQPTVPELAVPELAVAKMAFAEQVRRVALPSRRRFHGTRSMATRAYAGGAHSLVHPTRVARSCALVTPAAVACVPTGGARV